MRLPAVFMGLALFALSACASTPIGNPVAGKPAAIQVSDDAQPGPNPISANRAVAVYEALCLKQLPKFAGTEQAAIAEGGFVKHRSFGTYYHQRDNLSVKLINDGCSMVFQSTETVERVNERFITLSRAYRKTLQINRGERESSNLFKAFIKQN